MEEERKKIIFCVRIFNISPCVFTQISIGRARWIRNLIPHPTSTHTAYFWRTPLPQKQEKKRDDDIIITFFQVFLVFGVARPSKVCQVGTRWMWNLIPHSTSSPDRNLSKNTGIYVENTDKKSSFFMIPIPKFILKDCLRSIWYFNY